jgi:hypothetical protein
VLALGLGTVVYHLMEDWAWVDSFYSSAVALTTVGFGDLAPSTAASKLFRVAFSAARNSRAKTGNSLFITVWAEVTRTGIGVAEAPHQERRHLPAEPRDLDLNLRCCGCSARRDAWRIEMDCQETVGGSASYSPPICRPMESA